MPNKNSIESELRKTADYLYKIEGDCSPELYQAIDRLRQLTNEEFVGKNKQVSSQLIYDILIEAIQREVKKGRVEELKKLWNKTQPDIMPLGTPPSDLNGQVILDRLEELEG